MIVNLDTITPRTNSIMCPFNDTNIVLIGGSEQNRSVSDVYTFDTKSTKVTKLAEGGKFTFSSQGN